MSSSTAIIPLAKYQPRYWIYEHVRLMKYRTVLKNATRLANKGTPGTRQIRRGWNLKAFKCKYLATEDRQTSPPIFKLTIDQRDFKRLAYKKT